MLRMQRPFRARLIELYLIEGFVVLLLLADDCGLISMSCPEKTLRIKCKQFQYSTVLLELASYETFSLKSIFAISQGTKLDIGNLSKVSVTSFLV